MPQVTKSTNSQALVINTGLNLFDTNSKSFAGVTAVYANKPHGDFVVNFGGNVASNGNQTIKGVGGLSVSLCGKSLSSQTAHIGVNPSFCDSS